MCLCITCGSSQEYAECILDVCGVFFLPVVVEENLFCRDESLLNKSTMK